MPLQGNACTTDFIQEWVAGEPKPEQPADANKASAHTPIPIDTWFGQPPRIPRAIGAAGLASAHTALFLREEPGEIHEKRINRRTRNREIRPLIGTINTMLNAAS